MGSILADMESHFEPASVDDLIKFGFNTIKCSSRLIYQRQIRLNVPYKVPSHFGYIEKTIYITCTVRAIYKPNMEMIDGVKNIVSISVASFTLPGGVGFKIIRLKNPTIAEISAALMPVNLEKQFFIY
jgi:hypothetical protein